MNDMKRTLTLGSLFSGSGGFELGGILAGVTPVFASEIEPFAIRVTTKRLPGVKHYGDVSRLDGAKLPPVDIITFGSPCQDMSIAGKRAGLDGSRSGLFHEAIRIIKEMRNATDGKYPRYIVWENVPGAFSSNGGADFRSVLEEICRVKDGEADVPQPERWEHAGQIVGKDYSVAWRVFDAQYWGVPQRRKRIYLVADFAGPRASKVLFESDGLSGYSAAGVRAWQSAARCAEGGAGEAGGCLKWCVNPQGCSGISVTEDSVGTLVAEDHGNHPAVAQSAGFCTEHSAKAHSIGYEEERAPTLRAGVVPAAMALESNPTDARLKISEGGIVQTLTGRMGTGGNNTPLVADPEPMTLKIRCGKEGGGKGPLVQKDMSATLATNNDQTLFRPVGFDRYNGDLTGDISQTLNACAGSSGDNQPMVFEPSYGISKEAYHGGGKAGFNFAVSEELASTLQATECGAVAKPEPKAFGVCSKSSYAMLSDNPDSGFYEADTSRTLDQGGGSPCCNQGGICVVAPDPETYDVRFTSEGLKVTRGHVYPTDTARTLSTDKPDPAGNQGGVAVLEKDTAFALQGSMIGRQEKNGPQGGGVNEDVSFTLNTADKHAVAQPTYSATVGSFMSSSEETAQTLMARDYKDPQIVNDPLAEEPMYIVRRLTPVECARLQGFPDWWCMGLETPEPTDEDIAFWTEVFETHRRLTTPDGKPKTRSQIVKWLQNPYTDSAEYRLWGNGICLNNGYFVIAGIVWADSLPG